MKNKKALSFLLIFWFYAPICPAIPNTKIFSNIKKHFPHFEPNQWRVESKEGKNLVYAFRPFDDCSVQEKRLLAQINVSNIIKETAWITKINSKLKSKSSTLCKIIIPYSELQRYFTSAKIQRPNQTSRISFMNSPDYRLIVKNFPHWGENQSDQFIAEKIIGLYFKDWDFQIFWDQVLDRVTLKAQSDILLNDFLEKYASQLGEDFIINEAENSIRNISQGKFFSLIDDLAKNHNLIPFGKEIGSGAQSTYEASAFLSTLNNQTQKITPAVIQKENLSAHNNTKINYEKYIKILGALNDRANLYPHDNFPFIRTLSNDCSVFAYYSSGNLSEHIQYNRAWLLRPEQFCSIIDDLLTGAEIMHELNILHNDLKSANILLEWDPVLQIYRAKIADFGLSRLNYGGHISTAGSIGNIEPERYLLRQIQKNQNDPNGKYEDFARSDMWSIGEVLYRIVSGHGLSSKLRNNPTEETVRQYYQDVLEDYQNNDKRKDYALFDFYGRLCNELSIARFIDNLLIPVRKDRMDIKSARHYFNQMKQKGICTDKYIFDAQRLLIKEN